MKTTKILVVTVVTFRFCFFYNAFVRKVVVVTRVFACSRFEPPVVTPLAARIEAGAGGAGRAGGAGEGAGGAGGAGGAVKAGEA